MDAPMTITQRELLCISPEVCSQYKDSTTTRRMPYNNGTTAQNYRKIETEDCNNQQLLATVTDIQPTYAFLPGRGITLYRTIRFKERIQCIGPSEFTGPRESVNVIPN